MEKKKQKVCSFLRLVYQIKDKKKKKKIPRGKIAKRHEYKRGNRNNQ